MGMFSWGTHQLHVSWKHGESRWSWWPDQSGWTMMNQPWFLGLSYVKKAGNSSNEADESGDVCLVMNKTQLFVVNWRWNMDETFSSQHSHSWDGWRQIPYMSIPKISINYPPLYSHSGSLVPKKGTVNHHYFRFSFHFSIFFEVTGAMWGPQL